MLAGSPNRGETGRILDIPRFPSVEYVAEAVAPFAHRLRPIQRQALSVLADLPAPYGIVGDIGVGHGKTGIAALAGLVTGASRPVALIPPDAIRQFHRDMADWQVWVPALRGKVPRVVSHGALSSRTQADVLDREKPDLLVIDEAHAFRALTSARTKRLLRYLVANPMCRVVVLTGTLFTGKLADSAHLVELALREFSPIPRDAYALDLWAQVLDPGSEPSDNARAVFQDVCRWAGTSDPQAAFRARWTSAPGVITTPDASVRCSLYLGGWRPSVPPAVAEALAHLEATWELPDGTQLVDATEFSRSASQLAVGFYYRWIWPEGEKNLRWLDARSAWAATVRNLLAYHAKAGMDSPALVCERAAAGMLGDAALRAWNAWEAVRGEYDPEVEAVWVDDGVLRQAVEYAEGTMRRGLVWYQHAAVGAKLLHIGVSGDVLYGAGSDVPPPDVDVAYLSIPAHHKGKNLQAWSKNLVLQPPGSNVVWEQLLGRTHRQGQTADEVTCLYAAHHWTFNRRLATSREQARARESTTGATQKLCYAMDWTP